MGAVAVVRDALFSCRRCDYDPVALHRRKQQVHNRHLGGARTGMSVALGSAVSLALERSLAPGHTEQARKAQKAGETYGAPPA
jgi:hypothetical protein